MAAALLKPFRQDTGQGHATGGNAQQKQGPAVIGALQHLGGETIDRAAQVLEESSSRRPPA